jgi:RHS repeat-associated protein
LLVCSLGSTAFSHPNCNCPDPPSFFVNPWANPKVVNLGLISIIQGGSDSLGFIWYWYPINGKFDVWGCNPYRTFTDNLCENATLQDFYDEWYPKYPADDCWDSFWDLQDIIDGVDRGAIQSFIDTNPEWYQDLGWDVIDYIINYEPPAEQPKKDPNPASKNSVEQADGGDPVALSNGEYGLSVTDLSISGKALPVEIIRTYGSRREYNGRFGFGWDINYNMKVRPLYPEIDDPDTTEVDESEIVRVILLDGKGYRREYVETGEYTDKLTRDADRSDYLDYDSSGGTFTLVKKGGIEYNFDTNGNLEEIVDRHNNIITFTYEQNVSNIIGPSEFFNTEAEGGPTGGRDVIAREYKLTTITDDLNREIALTYNSDGLLWKITDFDNRVWEYGYDTTTNDLLTVKGPTTTDPITSQLVTTYAYDTGGNHNLLSITDPAGQTYITNNYNTNDEVSTQVYGVSEMTPQGDMTYVFNYDTTNSVAKVTSRNDKSDTITVYNDAGQVVKRSVATTASPHAAYVTENEYNSNSELEQTILPKRNCIDFEYDTNGNLETITQRPESDVLPFNGDPDCITVTDTANHYYDFDGTRDDFSIAFWIKRLSTGTEYLLYKMDSSDNGWSLKFDSNDYLVFSIDSSDISTNPNKIEDDDLWHYIAVSVDRDDVESDVVEIFIDGKSVGTGNPGSPQAFNANLYIGCSYISSTLGNYFLGSLDEVMILDRILSREETFGLSIHSEGLIGFWKMDDKTGTDVTDYSDSGIDGTSNRDISLMIADGKVPGTIETQYTYDGTYNFVRTITDPKGNVTTYNYDHEFSSDTNPVINELMAENTTGVQDLQSEYEDWIEIYNASDTAVDIAGMYITNDLTDPDKWQIPTGYSNATTISAYGYIKVWCDTETSDTTNQVDGLHVAFTLDHVNGGEIGLSDDGVDLLDSVCYDAMDQNESYGRRVDASPSWQSFASDPAPTPGTTNNGTTTGNLMEIVYPEVEVYDEASDSIIATNPVVSFTYYDTDDIKYGRVKTMTSTDSIVTQYEYYDNFGTDGDNYGHLKKTTVDSDITTDYEYDALGHVKKVTNDLSDSTEFLYSNLDQLLQITAPQIGETAGFITQMTYNRNKKLIKTGAQLGDWLTDPNQSIEYTYNLLDNLKKITDPLGNVFENFYDDNENLHKIQDAETNETEYVHDERDLLVKVYDAEGLAANPQYFTEYQYDKNGNLKKIEDALDQATSYEYDDYDRLIKVTYPQDSDQVTSTEEFTYDKNSNISSKQTRAGDIIYYDYDAMDRLAGKAVYVDGVTSVETVDNGSAPGGSNWSLETDSSDKWGTNYLSSTDNTDTYTFETSSNLTGGYIALMWWPSDATADSVTVEIYESTTPIGTTTVDQSIDNGRWNVLGTFEFDTDIGKVKIYSQGTKTTCADAVRFIPATTYLHDIAGRLIEADDDGDTTTHDYDALGRIEQVDNQDSRSVLYLHDSLGRRDKLTYPDNSYINYDYDEMGRLIYIDHNGDTDPLIHYEYDELSRREYLEYDYDLDGTYDGKIKYTYKDREGAGYSSGNQLGNWLVKIENDVDNDTTSDITFDYSYDNVGNRKDATIDSSLTHDYLYDKIYQLIEDDDSTDKYNFFYDWLGNRDYVNLNDSLDSDYSSENIAQTEDNDLNQYGSVDLGSGWQNYTYDDNGNLTDDGTYTYGYDSENRLITVDDTGAVATYSYDYQGRRISKTVGTATTEYVYDGDQVIAEYNSGDTLLRKFIYGPGIDEPICMIVPGTPDQWYFYFYDGLGSVVALSNSSGTIVEKYKYDAFGNVTICDGSGTPRTPNQSAYGNPYMFTGRRYDDETSLYYYRARYYKPDIGRFLQPDPIGYDDGMNMYTYVGNNPASFVDPFGLCKEVWKEISTNGLGNIIELDLQAIKNRMYDYEVSGKESLYDRLRNLPSDNFPVREALTWDSQFWHDYHEQVFRFQNRMARGSEINYFAMGMLMKHSGIEFHKAIKIVKLWKRKQMFRDRVRTVGLGSKHESKYMMPTSNELFFLGLGYHSYKTPLSK